MAKTRETAWEIDEDRIAASVDGTYIAGMPGLWRAGESIHPEAFGMSVSDFRDLVDELGLPLREVKVGDGDAARTLDPPDGRLPSSPVGAIRAATANPDATEIAGTDEPTIGGVVQTNATLDALADAAHDDGGQ